MSFPKYPEYKASGVEWLGEVPGHWRVLRLKQVASAFPSNVDKKTVEGETPVLLCNYTDVYYNDYIVAGMDFMAATATHEQVERFTLRRGDVIITKDSETADDIAIAAYVPEDLPGVVCGYHLTMIRAANASSGPFLKWLFGSRYLRARFEVVANGLTRVGLGQYAVDNVDLPIPPLAEQHAIAAFLDRETARIDALVAEQERLIELLREKRQAVISHAVTKGLDPTVPMKDSGVEWLGEVPAHWRVGRIGYYASVENGTTPSRDNPGYWNEGTVPWIASGEVNQGRVREASEFITEKARAESSLRLIPIGAIIVGLIGQGKTRGMAAILEIEATINQNLAAIVCGPHIFPSYLFHAMTSAYNYVREYGRGGQHAALNCEVLRAVQVSIPPVLEQESITTYLDTETARIDSLIAEAERAIALLQERRAALISAAVTGQIDVRGVVQGPTE